MEKLILARDFLFKFFIIGFGFFIFSCIVFIFTKNCVSDIAWNLYSVEPKFYFNSMFCFLGLIKSVLFFLGLFPALALHWVIKDSSKNK